jgi:hypothetical protein
LEADRFDVRAGARSGILDMDFDADQQEFAAEKRPYQARLARGEPRLPSTGRTLRPILGNRRRDQTGCAPRTEARIRHVTP